MASSVDALVELLDGLDCSDPSRVLGIAAAIRIGPALVELDGRDNRVQSRVLNRGLAALVCLLTSSVGHDKAWSAAVATFGSLIGRCAASLALNSDEFPLPFAKSGIMSLNLETETLSVQYYYFVLCAFAYSVSGSFVARDLASSGSSRYISYRIAPEGLHGLPAAMQCLPLIDDPDLRWAAADLVATAAQVYSAALRSVRRVSPIAERWEEAFSAEATPLGRLVVARETDGARGQEMRERYRFATRVLVVLRRLGVSVAPIDTGEPVSAMYCVNERQGERLSFLAVVRRADQPYKLPLEDELRIADLVRRVTKAVLAMPPLSFCLLIGPAVSAAVEERVASLSSRLGLTAYYLPAVVLEDLAAKLSGPLSMTLVQDALVNAPALLDEWWATGLRMQHELRERAQYGNITLQLGLDTLMQVARNSDSQVAAREFDRS